MGLKVLTALDTAKTQWYHFKAIIIAGMGLFTDAYDLFCITPITVLLSYIYYPDNNNDVPNMVFSSMLGVALLGTAVGQVVFGRLGDLVGRRQVYGLALGLMVVSSLGCGLSICTKSRTCVIASLGLFRFMLGLGIGGDYPLSATIMSEFANRRTRGAFIAAVFSMQGFGILFSTIVTMTVCTIFDRATKGSAPDHTLMVADLAWRLVLMIGAIPAAITFYWRMKMPETARYTALVEKNVVQAAKDMEKVLEISVNQIMEDSSTTTPLSQPSYSLFSKQFLHHHGLALFSCSATWFLVDIVFYSNNLFQSQIYHFFLPDKHKLNAFQYAYNIVRLQAIIAICSMIPGYLATVFFIDRIGRRKIQMMGFVLMAAALFSIGGPYSYWSKSGKSKGRFRKAGFMFLYGLTFFFSNFGPNTTTFIVPAELFPARFRTTCHGISGASGKVGAIIGSIGFLWANPDPDHNHNHNKGAIRMKAYSLIILAVTSLLGALLTYFFTPETKATSLEDNERSYGVNQIHQ